MARRYTDLEPEGKTVKGICPLPPHSEKKASFTVYPETQSWYCFGCGRGGDVFTLVMLCERMTFIEALSKLAQQADIKPPNFAKENWDKWEREETERRKLHSILTLAAEYYHSRLPLDLKEHYYKQGYGFTDETIDDLKLGYADGHLISYLVAERKIPPDEVLKTGLGVKTPDEVKDFFVGRLVFPYWENGNVVYFIGRKTEHTPDVPWERGKYKKLLTYSEQHPYVSPLIKNDHFYGEDAIPQATRAGHLVVTEGVTDCIAAIQAAIPCISPVTTTISNELWPRFLRLTKGIPSIYLCNDNETSRQGEKEALEIARQLFGEADKEAYIIALPRPLEAEKIDLNDYLKTHSATDFEELRKQAPTFIEYEIYQIPPDTPKLHLAKSLEPVLQKLALIPPARATMYLNYTIRERFGLKARDLQGLDKQLSSFRKGARRDRDKDRGSPNPPSEEESMHRPQMTPEEKEEALQFLKDPRLIDRIREDITKLGVVGEDKTKVFIYLGMTSRKMQKTINMDVRAASGIGKNFIIGKVSELMPEEDVIVKSRITAHYADYLHEDAWKGKVVIIKERAGAEDADYTIRSLTDDTSAGVILGYLRKNPATGEHEAAERRVNGPLVLVQTSTKLEADLQNESRGFQVYLDESEEQRTRVHAAIKREALPHLSIPEQELTAIIRRHRNAQRLLQPLGVAIPYAELIEYPADQHRSSRDIKRLIATIQISAFLRQYQRQHIHLDGKTYAVATVPDYRVAYEHLKKILADTLADLNPTSRELLDAAKEIVERKKVERHEDKPYFTRKELEQRLRWQRQAVDRAIRPLENADCFDVDRGRKPYRYRILSEEAEEVGLRGVLTPEELEEKIVTHIDEIHPVYLEGHVSRNF